MLRAARIFSIFQNTIPFPAYTRRVGRPDFILSRIAAACSNLLLIGDSSRGEPFNGGIDIGLIKIFNPEMIDVFGCPEG
jgi:hypothetical protein